MLLLPIVATSGWYVGFRTVEKKAKPNTSMVPRDYLIGLNFLLEEQPDKAVDVFIKMLEVDSDTVETHLALGSLFRRRGEVDRAIRIHQNLIARPHLSKHQRIQALIALGQDYMRAGVLDRAERVFLEVVEQGGEEGSSSLKSLLDIYQQEKAWNKAIQIARKLESLAGLDMQINIAHYYCEMALIAQNENDMETARGYLRKALAIDPKCARASLLHGDIEMQNGRYKAAIRFYKNIKQQNPDYLSETLLSLEKCYDEIGDQPELVNYLRECLGEHPRISIVLALAKKIQQLEGISAATTFIADFLTRHPSIRGLKKLIELQLQTATKKERENLIILEDLTETMLEKKPVYLCNHCGFNGKQLHWICPRCRHWSTMKPIHGLEGD
jgi:lipopolysaccharide biosynthesis regulator YciM